MPEDRVYICIDLKSFYASVECVDRGLDPFTTNLVVADPSRSSGTICLAITPAMKALGVRNRCRIFEIPAGIDYITAKPRMRRYLEVSAQIYSIYLKYISAQDMHVYSVDECFIDVTPYVSLYEKTPKELTIMLMGAVFDETGICATAGIGTNLFLAKVALDITAKHADDHIGFLNRELFRETMWGHQPITDFWNIGPGIARRLARHGVHDLRGVCCMEERTLYSEFGVNAEYLIDHAHGVEPCTMEQIHAYEPKGSSLSSGQVLMSDYTFEDATTVFREMSDALVLDLVDKRLVTDSISLYIGYSWSKDWAGGGQSGARGGDGQARGGHRVPSTGGSRKLPESTNSFKKLMDYLEALYLETTRRTSPIRRINISFGNLKPEEFATLSLFSDFEAEERENRIQKAAIAVKEKFGKNALLKGMSLKKEATGRERNEQVGGHHA